MFRIANDTFYLNVICMFEISWLISVYARGLCYVCRIHLRCVLLYKVCIVWHDKRHSSSVYSYHYTVCIGQCPGEYRGNPSNSEKKKQRMVKILQVFVLTKGAFTTHIMFFVLVTILWLEVFVLYTLLRVLKWLCLPN